MSNVLLSIIVFEIAFFIFIKLWYNEVTILISIFTLWILITFVMLIWVFHFGNKYYRISYRDTKGNYRKIDFPPIWW